MPEYNRNSVDAVLSRIETKLDDALRVQGEHSDAITKLKSALQRLDVRVTLAAGGVTVLLLAAKAILFGL